MFETVIETVELINAVKETLTQPVIVSMVLAWLVIDKWSWIAERLE
ncbi:hypothetical protein [Brevibacillus porteri]